MKERGFKVSAVVLGLGLAAGGWLAVALVLASLAATGLLVSGVPFRELGDELASRLDAPATRLVWTALAALFAAKGAGFSARLESHAPFRHSLAVGIGLVLLVVEFDPTASAGLLALNSMVLLLAAGFGAGRVAHRQRWARRAPELPQGSLASNPR